VVRNTPTDQARKANRRRDADTEAAISRKQLEKPNHENDDQSLIQSLNLNSTDQLILNLWRDGRCHAAIAEAAGMREPAVRQRLSRILRKAREQIESRKGDPQ